MIEKSVKRNFRNDLNSVEFQWTQITYLTPKKNKTVKMFTRASLHSDNIFSHFFLS